MRGIPTVSQPALPGLSGLIFKLASRIFPNSGAVDSSLISLLEERSKVFSSHWNPKNPDSIPRKAITS